MKYNPLKMILANNITPISCSNQESTSIVTDIPNSEARKLGLEVQRDALSPTEDDLKFVFGANPESDKNEGN